MKNALFAIMMGLVGVFAVGCGGNACEDAAEICGAGEATEEGAEEAECSGATECAANCIVDADSCDTTDEALVTCITDCQG